MTCFTDLPTLNLREVKKIYIFSDHRPYLWWLSAHAHQETTSYLGASWFWAALIYVKSASLVSISTSVVHFSSSFTFWDLLESVWKEKSFQVQAWGCHKCSNCTFCNSCQDVGPHHELAVCQLFDCKYVVFNLKSEKETQATSSTGSVRSAFGVLMSRDVPRDFRLSWP